MSVMWIIVVPGDLVSTTNVFLYTITYVSENKEEPRNLYSAYKCF